MRSLSDVTNLRRARRHGGKALALLAAGALALMAWGAVSSFQKRQDHYRHQAERELQTINHLQAQSVLTWREQRLTDAMALSDDALFEQAARQWRDAPDTLAGTPLLERLRLLQERANYTAVYFVDTDGRVLLAPMGAGATGARLPEPEQQALRAALASAQARMAEPRNDPFFAFPFVSVLAPLFDGPQPLGAVWLVSDVRSSLYPLLEHWPTRSASAESGIVSRSGDVALHLSPLRSPKEEELALRIPLAHTSDPAVQALAGARGIFYGQNHRGSPVMAAASAVPASPWHVVTTIDTAEVFADTQLREVLALSLPISLGLLGVGLVFAELQRRGRLRERALKTELQRNMRWLEGAQKAATLGYFAYEVAPRTFTMSSMASQIFGLAPGSSMPLRQWIGLIHPEQRQEVLGVHERAIAQRGPLQAQYRICRANGQGTRWVQVWGEYETGGADPHVARMLGTVQDITERKESEQALADYRAALEEKMRLDPLTDVANRRALDEHVATQWQRAMRSQRALSLLMIDVDHFKRYNDHYGHVEGDECLQRVARTLAAMVTRADELVARYGGEEFAVLLPDTEAPQALALAQKMCAAVRQLSIAHASSDTAPHVTVSIGVACLHPMFCSAGAAHAGSAVPASGTALDAGLAQALFEQADAALYTAKQQGRDQAVLQPGLAPGPL